MIKYTTELYAEMMRQLQQLKVTAGHELQKAEQSFHIVEAALIRLKEYITGYEFRDEKEEIQFFKEIKPMFHCELVYLAELIHIETNKPVGSKELVTGYYRKVIQRLQLYFERHHSLHTYCLMGRNNEDQLYFLRKTDNLPLLPEASPDLDRQFSTVCSSIMAKMQGYEMMIEHLQHQIDRMENGGPEGALKHQSKTMWTDSKAALVELAYAIYARGAVNYGKADIKEIITDLEYLFNIRVGNFYRVYMDITIRKKNRTPFIDSLKESLERRMDEGLG